MDGPDYVWYKSDMNMREPIPVWQLYGENRTFPDLLHIETIRDRAVGLDWTIAPHRHLHLHQVFLLLSGTIAASIDGVPHDLTPPVIINIPRSVVHDFRFSAGTEGYVLTLPAGDFPELFDTDAEASAGLGTAFVQPASQDLATRFAVIDRLHGTEAPLRRTRLRAEVTALVCDLLIGREQDRGTTEAGDARLRGFFERVRVRLREHLTVAEHAAALGLSPRHLSRLCQAATGLSAQRYVDEQRLREACRLLVYTRMSVQAVAFALGYDDPAYFSRAFQRRIGQTPTAYRQQFD
ncbi:helix-turn-helix domain-containing protein [Oryzibacter oryziterrae]|uniref:helix-turn-helix domain-containing protein n=1 Tax=Oryzibacter oryziterrae TaxID=2766474 RepID=UPI001EFFCE2C|nr:helix-turn-helix domain-containing protein [Oryzibacter oryziterrae]